MAVAGQHGVACWVFRRGRRPLGSYLFPVADVAGHEHDLGGREGGGEREAVLLLTDLLPVGVNPLLRREIHCYYKQIPQQQHTIHSVLYTLTTQKAQCTPSVQNKNQVKAMIDPLLMSLVKFTSISVNQEWATSMQPAAQ